MIGVIQFVETTYENFKGCRKVCFNLNEVLITYLLNKGLEVLERLTVIMITY